MAKCAIFGVVIPLQDRKQQVSKRFISNQTKGMVTGETNETTVKKPQVVTKQTPSTKKEVHSSNNT